MEKSRLKIGHEENIPRKDEENIFHEEKDMGREKIVKYTRRAVEWGIGILSLFLFAKGMYSEALKNGFAFIAPKVAILLTIAVSVYSWRIAICNSFLSRKEEHLFYHKTILGIVIGVFGAISGNPWLLFFLTSRSLNAYLFVLMFFTHLALWGSIFFIESPAIHQIISTYPTIATLVVNVEEILSEKGMHCTYQKSRKYLLSISITFISFCIIGMCLSPHIQSIPSMRLKIFTG